MTITRKKEFLVRGALPLCIGRALYGCTTPSSEDWVPVYEEPKHKLVFDNDQVQILNVNLPPGYVSLYHKHQLDTMYVTISGTQVWAQPLGGDKRMADVKTGDLRFSSDNHELPHIHRVGNVGEAPFHIIGVAVKADPSGEQDVLSGKLNAMKLVDERPNTGVYRITLQPGESSGEHTHKAAFTQVHLTDGTLGHSSGETVEVTASDFLWHPGGVTHSYENAGKDTLEIVEVIER